MRSDTGKYQVLITPGKKNVMQSHGAGGETRIGFLASDPAAGPSGIRAEGLTGFTALNPKP